MLIIAELVMYVVCFIGMFVIIFGPPMKSWFRNFFKYQRCRAAGCNGTFERNTYHGPDTWICRKCNDKWILKRHHYKIKESADIIAGGLAAHQNLRGDYPSSKDVADRAWDIAEALHNKNEAENKKVDDY
jgi:hypothetical protein